MTTKCSSCRLAHVLLILNSSREKTSKSQNEAPYKAEQGVHVAVNASISNPITVGTEFTSLYLFKEDTTTDTGCGS